jgi:hypothetical protein
MFLQKIEELFCGRVGITYRPTGVKQTLAGFVIGKNTEAVAE